MTRPSPDSPSDPLPDPWPAPHATAPVRATVRLPGSKSLTNRALVLAALADGPSVVRRPLRSRDSELMVAGLRALGATIDTASDDWTVTPGTSSGSVAIDCGLAGTVMRFLPPVAALTPAVVRFDGDPHARTRPMLPVLQALRDLGVDVEDDRGRLPVVVRGSGEVRGGVVAIDASSSSQFVSALLLAGARFTEGLDLRHRGPSLPSQPHIDMTLAMLRERGVDVRQPDPERWLVAPGTIGALDVDIEPDLSNAAPFAALGLVTGGEVRVAGWPERSTQPGADLRELLPRLGAQTHLDADGLSVSGDGRVQGADLDLSAVGELTPVLAALCALADSPSRIRGVGHIRGHETDRLAALCAEINSLGGDVKETDDGLDISPAPLHGGVFRTYADHRMAHAGALIGAVVPGVAIENVATTAKTYPAFPHDWAELFR